MSNIIAHAPSESSIAERPTAGMAALLAARPELGKGLAKAIAAAHAVEKDAHNAHHKYDYASSDGIIEAARLPLAEAGLSLIPIEASLNGSEREGPDRFELVRTFLLLHSSGEALPLRVTWPVVPGAGRPLDKATGAADTLSLAYLLRDLLLMPRVDKAIEVNARDDRPPQAQKSKKNQSMDGAEFARRIQGKENGLVRDGRCQPGELIAHLHKQGQLLGEPAELVRWSDAGIKSARDWVRSFDAMHPAPAAQQPAANGTAAPPAKISADQVRELAALLERKGRKWPLVVQVFDLPRMTQPADLMPVQYAEITKALAQEPDVQTARK